jgi:hypothetical protein
MAPPADARAARGLPGGGSSILVERLTADETFNTLYEQAAADLRGPLFDSGTAQEVLDRWVDLLGEQAGGLVDEDAIQSEAGIVSAVLDEDPGGFLTGRRSHRGALRYLTVTFTRARRTVDCGPAER